jgi:hypothetical protein
VTDWMTDSSECSGHPEARVPRKNWIIYLLIALIPGAIYLGCVVSPPSLMDDVDAVQASIARNMLTSGDCYIPRAIQRLHTTLDRVNNCLVQHGCPCCKRRL